MATVALSSLRSTLQTFLKDTQAKKWSGADLRTFINLAITKWTTDLPIRSSTEYTAVSGQHEYDMPENAVSLNLVYGYFESTGTAEWIPTMLIRPGAFVENDEPRRVIVGFPTESQFYLPRESQGSTFTVYYGARHTPLVDDTDTLNLRAYAWGELAVLYYAAYLAFVPYSASRARLAQWAKWPELNVGNPLSEQAELYKQMYEELMEQNAEPVYWEFVSSGRT